MACVLHVVEHDDPCRGERCDRDRHGVFAQCPHREVVEDEIGVDVGRMERRPLDQFAVRQVVVDEEL